MCISTKTNYWLSYMTIFLLPILCLGVFTYLVTSRELTKDALEKNTITLQKVSNLLDSQVQQIYQIPVNLSLTSDSRDFQMKEDIYGAQAIKKELRSYMLMNNFVSDIYLYFHGDDYLLSPTTSVTLGNFQEILYQYPDWSQQSFELVLNGDSLPQVRGVETVGYLKQGYQDQITFLMPVGYLTGQPYATLMIILKSSSIYDMLGNSGLQSSSQFLMLDRHRGTVLFSSNGRDYATDSAFIQFLQQGAPSQLYTLEGEQYQVAQKTSPISDICYVSITPMKELTQSVRQLRLVFAIVLILLLLTGFLAISYFLNRSYNPIKNLRQFSRTLVIEHGEENPFLSDEIEEIRRCLEFLNENNASLQNQVLRGKDHLRDCLLFDLIRGEFATLNQFNEAAAQANICFEHELYAVAVIFCKSYRRHSVGTIIKDMQERFEVPYRFYAHQHLDADKILLILNFPAAQADRLPGDLGRLNRYFIESFSLSPSIGLGRYYTQVNYISKSFLEALTAVNYRLVRGNDCVITYQECLPKDELENSLPPIELEPFGKLLQNGDEAAVERFLGELRSRIESAGLPIYVVKSTCFDLVQELQKAAASVFMLPRAYCGTLDLLEYDTTQELFHTLVVVCRSVCNAVLESARQEETDRVQAMVRYIESNCKDPDFSTDRMAEAFSLSPSALCQYFKVRTNQTITDFLVDFRITRAKELLTTTKFHLNQIAYEVGYYNVSSFIRRFKQMVGCSPGVYREAAQRNELNVPLR